MDRGDIALALALLVGVALTGQLSGLLESLGYPTLGTVAWPVGFGSIVLVAWYVWIRPIDFRAPGSEEETVWTTEREEPTDPER